MFQVALPIPKRKITKKNLIVGVVVIFLILMGVSFWLQPVDKIPEFNLGLFFENLTAGLTQLVQREELPEHDLEDLEIILPLSKEYEQTAQAGEGITHLARRALAEYLEEKEDNLGLTSEHKIYIEDYLQKEKGSYPLQLGENVSFNSDLIKEAIEKAQELTPEQLNNLEQYSAMVANF